MKTETKKDIYAAYLLGDLPESERERLEQDYFANPEALDALYAAEDDLIDAYVRGLLSAREGKLFESYFLDSASRRRRVEFAKTLWTAVKGQEQLGPKTKVMHANVGRFLRSNAALATGLSLALIFLALLGLQNRHLLSEISKGQSAQLRLQNQIQQLRQESDGLQAELAVRRDWPLRAEGETVALLLLPGSSRGAGSKGQSLVIPPQALAVVLALDLGQDHGDSYRAVLETAEGSKVRDFDDLKRHPLENGNQAIFLKIPAKSLRAGEFVIRAFAHIDQKRVVELHPYSLMVVH